MRNPLYLWEVLEELCRSDPQFHQDLEVFLAGTIDKSVL
jgi:hypothetical protein